MYSKEMGMLDLREQAADKTFLRSLADNDYEVPEDIDCFNFALALLPNFSSPDEELRDELSYMLLARGIIDKGRLDSEQLQQLLTVTLDKEHLFDRIGEIGTDSVFMRSFFNLIIAAILYTDAKNPTLPAHTVIEVKTALLGYAQQERDWRGFVEGKGWAHAMAHLADALDECAQHPAMHANDREEILDLLTQLASISEPLYHEEDVRLATVAYHIILGKQVREDFLSYWVEKCFIERGTDVASWVSATNMKNFLRSLYFFLLWDSIGIALADQISDQLKRQDSIYLSQEDAQE
jgi:hypothetical protein